MPIGLTGGIGAGKSTAAALLVQMGWHLVDTDAIARQLTARDGAALPALRARFGDAVFTADGSLDRALLRQRVFTQPQDKAALEALLHPLIQLEASAQALGRTHVVFDVPLLVESAAWRARLPRVLLLDCDETVQLARVAARPGWSIEQARAVIASQAPRAQRRAAADAVIDNSALPLTQLQATLQSLTQAWQPL